ncbi:MAG: hypothetical protein WDN04_23365 [Rhodospirillales bacterium]
MTKNFLAGAALMTAATMLAAPAARAGSDEANLVSRARIVVDDLKTDQEFGNARSLLRRARGVLIVPQLIKGGFFVAARVGPAFCWRAPPPAGATRPSIRWVRPRSGCRSACSRPRSSC